MRAQDILARELRATYSESGILASTGHFNDVWSRDVAFASEASLALGDAEIVRKSLGTLIEHEREGLIPLKVGRGSQLLKFVGIHTKRERVWYSTDKNRHPPADSSGLFLIALAQYVERTGDRSLLKDEERLERVFKVAQRLEQGPYTDWADSLKRDGRTLFVHACAAASAKARERLSGKGPRAMVDLEQFWNGKFYEERPGNGILDVAANLLVIRWSLTSHAQDILCAIADASSAQPHLPITSSPSHPLKDKYLPLVLVGMGDYHDEQRWSWIAGLYLQVLREHDPERYPPLKKAWERKVIEDGGVFEVYEPDGRPLRRLAYSSQKPFAWGAAMMLLGLGP